MKKIFVVCALLMTFIVAQVSADNMYPIPFEQLPAPCQVFVKTHFPNAQVTYCVRESRGYEIKFADAMELEFTKAGLWKEVDCKYGVVPESVLKLIPPSIPTYIKSVFPQAVITRVKLDGRRYEVKINTGLEFEFNKAGTFMRIDD